MVFAIGWSGVSIASAKVMQMSMQHQQMMSSSHHIDGHQTKKEYGSVQQLKNLCTDINKNKNGQNQHTNDDQAITDQNDCHQQVSQSEPTQAFKCQDCSLLSCQSSVIWFNSDIPKLIIPDHFQNSASYPATYRAQHLAGFWQEILRPPKA
ncbi:hypothetical protein ABIC56_003089 [Acinetobacter bereziniae]|uniref:hypothetical protein n=1 Tax=Acinetobacter bereziniae TaxID=106648 RepID=UPI00285BCDF2|nr:hypothetical protein [Acinetobacter bereziniae]